MCAEFVHSRLSDGISEPLGRLPEPVQGYGAETRRCNGDSSGQAIAHEFLLAWVPLFSFQTSIQHLRLVLVLACRALQSELTKKFVDCTKEDTMMSVWITRARRILCGNVSWSCCALFANARFSD